MSQSKSRPPRSPDKTAAPAHQDEPHDEHQGEHHAHPLAEPIIAAIRQAQTQHNLFPHVAPARHSTAQHSTVPQPVVVGVSGGADSVCLLHALYSLREEWRLDLHVAHLDHALRADSPADAEWVRDLARQLQLPFHTTRLDPGSLADTGEGPEAAARHARYAFLQRIAFKLAQSALGASISATPPSATPPIIAVAHHLDDQAETVLMNLIRGTGLTGLAGMTPVANLPVAFTPHMNFHTDSRNQSLSEAQTESWPIRLVRPLLNVTRAQIHAYLQHQRITWREDPTNTDPVYLRNRVRTEILPLLAQLNPQIHAALARTANLVAGDAQRLAQLDRETLETLLCQQSPQAPLPQLQQHGAAQRLVLNAHAFHGLSRAARRGVIRQALACFNLPPRVVGYAQIESLLQTIEDPVLTHQPTPQPPPGPHPLAGNLLWSWLPSTRGPGAPQPPRLSLHTSSVLPWQPDHPHLQFLFPPEASTPVRLRLACPGDTTLTYPQDTESAQWQIHIRLLSPADLPPAWPAHASPWEAWLDADAVHELTLVMPQPGMIIAPLGLHGHTQSVGDLFTNAKIHPSLRPGWPVIQARLPHGPDPVQPQVVWICGLAVSHHAALTPATRRIVHLAWQVTSNFPSD